MKKSRWIASIFALAFVAATIAPIFAGPAETAAPSAAPVVVEDNTGAIKYRMTTLPNGFRIISVEDFSVPIAAVHVWYEVGSKDEDPNRQGFAHMFEHMMFRGTQVTGPKDHFEYIRSVGGDNNAYTAFDQTVYTQTLPSNQVEMAIWLESERMAFLKVTDEYFQVERKVVEEELRLRGEQPFGKVPEKLLAQMFTEHPYRWTPAGNIPNLRAASTSELQDFWEKYYVPNNATLVVVGAVKHAEVERLATKYFGWIPRYPDPPRVTIREPKQTKPRTITLKEDSVPVAVVAVGYFTVESGHQDEIALDMMWSILGGGESSRLYKKLVNETESAVIAAAGQFSLQQAGIGGAGAVLPPIGGDKEKVRKEIYAEIETLKKEGVTERELEKAKNSMLRNEVTQLRTVEAKAAAIGQAAVVEGNIANVNTKLDRIRAVTTDDIKRVANAYLREEGRNDVTIEPSIAGFVLGKMFKIEAKNEEDAPVAPSPEGARFGEGKPGLLRPDLYGPKPPRKPLITKAPLPQARTTTLANGLKVVVVEDTEIPFVSFTLGIKNGSFTDPEDAPGTASAAASLITRGTESFTYEELAEELETNAISLGGGIGMDTGTVSASALKEKAPRALELLAEVVQRPTFPEDEFSKFIKQQKTGLAISDADPSNIADRQLRRALYGEHPYARTTTGELADQDKLTVTASRDWWNEWVRPDTTVLYIAGDVKRREILPLVEKHFGDWKAEGKAPSAEVPAIPQAVKTNITLVDKAGSTQAQIRAAHIGITRKDPNYFESRIINQVFGGSFGSRLNEAVRVQKGLTYGAFGGFGAQRFAGTFTMSTFSKTESAAAALQVLLDESRRLLKDPLTKEEIDLARNYLVGSFVGSRETPEDIVSDEWLVESEGLSKDYYKRYLRAISKATVPQVNKAARALVQPDKLSVVVVGDAEKMQDDLEKIAPTTLVTLSEDLNAGMDKETGKKKP